MSAFHDNALMGASGSQGYTISRSVRLRSSASAYFNRTPAGAGTSNKTFTYSAWVKRGSLGSIQNLISSPNSGNSDSLRFSAADALEYNWQDTVVGQVTTTQVFRDPSAWYHIMFAMDTTQATASNRFKLYVNGVQVTAFATASYPAQNTVVNNTAAVATKLGQYANASSQNFDGYLTEINFVDGQALTPTSFGQFNSVTGVWQPLKYTGTYGTNGFYLNFSDNSNNTATTIGKDYSGNGNNWTPNNISVTSGVTYDSMIDSPTVSAVSSNYAVLNAAYIPTNTTLSSGNLDVVGTSAAYRFTQATFNLTSGKWYFEMTKTTTTQSVNGLALVLPTISRDATTPLTTGVYNIADANTSQITTNTNGGSNVIVGTTNWANGDVIQCAYDADTGKIWFGRNGTWYPATNGGTVGDPALGTNPTVTGVSGLTPASLNYSTSSNSSMNFGQRPFSYTPPTGFKALNTFNLPTPTIVNGANYMAATTYTGNGTARSIDNTVNGVSMQPDLVWIKSRSTIGDTEAYDSVRGATKYLLTDSTTTEGTAAQTLTAFNSNGFSLGTGSGGNDNTNGTTYIGWQWKAGGASSSNTNGSITSTVSVNATAGFSVVTWTNPSSGIPTIGHGLGVAPTFIIVKDRTYAYNWDVGCTSIGWANRLNLNTTGATSSGFWNSTAPTSTVFTYSSSGANSGDSMVAYCFAEVAGYSKFGSYTGNGSTDGVFVQLGFRARYLLIKETGNANSWEVYDTARNTSNVQTKRLFPNDSLAEATTDPSLDILSNGFKCRAGNTGINRSGGTYIYMAFAENPFKYSLAR